MKYKIWNKIDKINNVDSQHFIKNLNIQQSDGVFLILDNNTNVKSVEIDRVIKSVYNLDANLSCEEVAQKYLEIKQQEEQKQKEEIENKLKQEGEIEQLKKENANINYILMKNDLL